MRKVILFLAFLICTSAFGQKVPYTIDGNGVHFVGVDQSNPVIFDNDMVMDSPELPFLWLKANKGQVKLVGNINTRDLFIPPNIYATHDATFSQWQQYWNAAQSMGLKNIPAPIKGSDMYLTRPANGVIEQTVRKDSPGSDLIISEARKATAAKPLVVFVGGQVTSIANAYLKANDIWDKIIVFHVDGWGKTNYNGVDYWATEIVMRKMKYINWDGDLNAWYEGAGYWGNLNKPAGQPVNIMPGLNFSTMPVNAFSNLFKGNFVNVMIPAYGSVGDSPPILYFFNHGLWMNIAKKYVNNSTTTADNYDFLSVSQNKWVDYGPMIAATMNDPNNYIPGGTIPPPVNVAPVVSISSPNTFLSGTVSLTANATDADGTVAKVEFFSGSTKLGEDPTDPYLILATLTAGTYQISARATDNQGAIGSSTIMVVTVSDPTPTPTPGPWAKGVFSPSDYGAKGDGVQDDGPAFNAAIAAYRSVRGATMIIQPPDKFYSIRTQVNFTPDGTGQLFMDVVAMLGPGGIRWQGADNSIAFKIVGLKASEWSGMNVAAEAGKTGINLFDIDCTTSAQSTSFNFMRGFYLNLGNRPNNVGFRLGHVSGGSADISDYHFEHNTIIGNEGGTPQPGQVAYLVEGINTLACEVVGGFVAWCDNVFSNKSKVGATSPRGNSGTAYFTNVQTSQNLIDYSIHFEGTYVISGVRAESSRDVLEVGQGTGSPSITFVGCRFNDYKGNQVATINSAATLSFINCQFHKQAVNRDANGNLIPNPFPQMFVINSTGNSGTIKIDNGTTHFNTLYTKQGNTVWKLYMEGVTRWSGPHANFTNTTHIPDIVGQLIP